MEGEEQSASTESRNSPPVLPPESPGSSVSTRLQEEYTELLKYAGGMHGGTGMLDSSVHSFQPINRSGGSSARQTPVDQQQDDDVVMEHSGENDEGNTNANSIYGRHTFESPTAGSSYIQTDTVTDINTNRKEKETITKKTKRTISTEDTEMTCMKSTIVDPTVSDISCKLDGWLGKLKSDILAEIGDAIIRTLDSQKQVHQRETQQIICEKQRLEREVNRLSELVNTCEVSMCRKDTLIENLTQALGKQRDKVSMAQAFYQCKAGLADGKRARFTEQLAVQHHERQLCQKVMKAWFGLIQVRWRKRVERVCQEQAQGVCKQLSTDYEDKIKSLNREIENLRKKVQFMQQEREQYSEQVKKAFMRGVCALNMEAMSAFSTEETPLDPHATGHPSSDSSDNQNTNISNNLESNHPSKLDRPAKSLPPEPVSPVIADLQSDRGQYHSLLTSSTTAGHPQKSKSKLSKTKSRSSTSGDVSSPRQPSRSSSSLSHTGPLAPPMASIVVERHNPVTKQTVGKATAMRFPKQDSKDGRTTHSWSGTGMSLPRPQPTTATSQQSFRLLAGQSTGLASSPSSVSPSIKVVE